MVALLVLRQAAITFWMVSDVGHEALCSSGKDDAAQGFGSNVYLRLNKGGSSCVQD